MAARRGVVTSAIKRSGAEIYANVPGGETSN